MALETQEKIIVIPTGLTISQSQTHKLNEVDLRETGPENQGTEKRSLVNSPEEGRVAWQAEV